ncbi:MAG TPA: ParB/RepB/Spo0J family partition protein [Candidatus Saccharicenans sp.]|jgi:ParB family chromosome partitioning protein|nr:ParB/RepB/Spo0J family partition protein [Candidatus Saccharicenans sp.]HOJ25865.1 ParB/RepB/Spo0J family partition protein [Candidatus Saccharicenans sp.]HOL45033.1 ParB/RepB/Spo0J family partition protein [Candidatus Saccharicenans sp.]HOM93452.1 ParB/RepB/Spo0J family partition protein [Candidatus Saccharicenans sp.]HOP60395.1 ParB/RepB/Spo0J family partition protein [Candidatus Saccharicenans sp.]
MTKKALGKGLEAFIPEEFGILKEDRYAEVEIEKIRPNPHQPRTQFDEASINELATSIKETGIIQPLLVVPEEDHYKLIVGERRWRAAQRAGLRVVPVIIRNMTEDKQLEVSLIENIHREDLNPLEIAEAFERLVNQLGLTQQEVADRVGKDRASVANYIRLLKLQPEIKTLIRDGKLSMGQARAILSLEDEELQKSVAFQAVEKSLSVRETEKLVQKLKERPPRTQKSLEDPDLKALEEELIQCLGTKVTIAGQRNKGTIRIFYFSLEELNRIYDKIKGVKA